MMEAFSPCWAAFGMVVALLIFLPVVVGMVQRDHRSAKKYWENILEWQAKNPRLSALYTVDKLYPHELDIDIPPGTRMPEMKERAVHDVPNTGVHNEKGIEGRDPDHKGDPH